MSSTSLHRATIQLLWVSDYYLDGLTLQSVSFLRFGIIFDLAQFAIFCHNGQRSIHLFDLVTIPAMDRYSSVYNAKVSGLQLLLTVM